MVRQVGEPRSKLNLRLATCGLRPRWKSGRRLSRCGRACLL